MKIIPGPHHTIIANYRRLAAFLGEKIEKHKQDQDPNEPKDYIHSYLAEIENVIKMHKLNMLTWFITNRLEKDMDIHIWSNICRHPNVVLVVHIRFTLDVHFVNYFQRKNDKEVQFNTENLEWCIVDLFEGGTETTTNTLRWALLYMIKYPLIQGMCF